jgi:hypothetical protein
MTGMYNCVSRLVEDPDIENKITIEMTTYMNAEGLFGLPVAIRQRNTRAPGNLP